MDQDIQFANRDLRMHGALLENTQRRNQLIPVNGELDSGSTLIQTVGLAAILT